MGWANHSTLRPKTVQRFQQIFAKNLSAFDPHLVKVKKGTYKQNIFPKISKFEVCFCLSPIHPFFVYFELFLTPKKAEEKVFPKSREISNSAIKVNFNFSKPQKYS